MTDTMNPAAAAPEDARPQGEGGLPDSAAAAGTIPDWLHGPHCLTQVQREYLLKMIKASRVRKVPRGNRSASYIEAYEVRAHLTRIFGFANWSEDVVEVAQTFESSEPRQRTDEKSGELIEYNVWTVGYRATVRLGVNCLHGVEIAHYTEVAGDSSDAQPSRGDAHHNGLTAAASTALKRAATNLGDQFGLSLYKRGRLEPLVGMTLVGAWDGTPRLATLGTPDAHITDSPPETDASREAQAEPEPNNEPVDPPAWDNEPVAEASGEGRDPDAIKADADKLVAELGAEELKQRLLDLMAELTQLRGHAGKKATVRVYLIKLMRDAEAELDKVAKAAKEADDGGA
jgi:Rad52/22 family double-strand break repair protein